MRKKSKLLSIIISLSRVSMGYLQPHKIRNSVMNVDRLGVQITSIYAECIHDDHNAEYKNV